MELYAIVAQNFGALFINFILNYLVLFTKSSQFASRGDNIFMTYFFTRKYVSILDLVIFYNFENSIFFNSQLFFSRFPNFFFGFFCVAQK